MPQKYINEMSLSKSVQPIGNTPLFQVSVSHYISILPFPVLSFYSFLESC